MESLRIVHKNSLFYSNLLYRPEFLGIFITFSHKISSAPPAPSPKPPSPAAVARRHGRAPAPLDIWIRRGRAARRPRPASRPRLRDMHICGSQACQNVTTPRRDITQRGRRRGISKKIAKKSANVLENKIFTISLHSQSDREQQFDAIATFNDTTTKCGNSSVGRAQPCQGWGREFESRFPLTEGSLRRLPFSFCLLASSLSFYSGSTLPRK